MPEKLPKGWIKATLGEVATPSRERALPTELADMPYVGLEHIEPQSMKLLKHGYARQVRSSCLLFSKGDVLYGKMRPYLNKVWIAEFDGLCSAEFIVFPKHDGLNSQFLAARLNAEDFVTFANGQVSGERPRVDFEKLSSFPLLLPPAGEQERIMAKVDAILSAAGRAETAAHRAQERLKRYRASVLHAAVIGELTSQWRTSQYRNGQTHGEASPALLKRLLAARRAKWEDSELERLRAGGDEPKDDKWKSRYSEPLEPNTQDLPGLPEGWLWMSLDQLLIHLASGSRDWSKYYNHGTGTFLMAQNIRRTGLDLSFRQIVGPPPYDKDRARSQVVKDDVLVTIVGGNTGDVCIVPSELPEHFVCQSVALIRLAEPKFSRFIWLYLAADEDGQQQWRKMIYGAGRPHLGFEHLRATTVPVPPMAEQAEIVSEVNRRLAAANRLAATIEEQLIRAKATRQSLLRQAFFGRLVSQNPTDEPASLLLLKPIGADRKAGIPKTKSDHMSKTKSPLKPARRRSLLAVLKENGGPMTPEELFHVSGHSEETVDEFFAELRELTTIPAKISEERTASTATLLRALQ